MNKAELCEALAATGDNLYDFAWLDETSGWLHRFQPCSNCHNGYSVAKLFIATAMGLLWDEGKLSLDDPVGRFFPTDSPWRQVSVHHLLTHTSGIDRGFLDIDNDDLSQYPPMIICLFSWHSRFPTRPERTSSTVTRCSTFWRGSWSRCRDSRRMIF